MHAYREENLCVKCCEWVRRLIFALLFWISYYGKYRERSLFSKYLFYVNNFKSSQFLMCMNMNSRLSSIPYIQYIIYMQLVLDHFSVDKYNAEFLSLLFLYRPRRSVMKFMKNVSVLVLEFSIWLDVSFGWNKRRRFLISI